MNLEISNHYRTIIPITHSLTLERYYSQDAQLSLLSLLVETSSSTSDEHTLLASFKLCQHLSRFAAIPSLRHDAFLSMLWIQRHCLELEKTSLYHELFSLSFMRLYADPPLNDEQCLMCADTLAEYSTVNDTSLRQRLLLFYLDTSINPRFHLIQHRQLLPRVVSFVCRSLTNYLLSEESSLCPLLPEHPSPSLATLNQRFYTDFIYGSHGITQDKTALSVVLIVIDSLAERVSLDGPHRPAAKDALVFLMRSSLKRAQNDDWDENALASLQDKVKQLNMADLYLELHPLIEQTP